MLQALIERTQQAQQVFAQERRERELESRDVSQKITQICNAIEQQQRLLATNQQTIKNELMQEVAKKMECGVPSEVKKEPPGLTLGMDEMGARCEKPKKNRRRRAQRRKSRVVKFLRRTRRLKGCQVPQGVESNCLF